MEFIEIMEKIGKNPEQLEKLLELKKFDEVYQLLKKNGYKKSPEMLREDVEELITKGLMRLENAELSKVSGGGLKENITRATSLGMASLLMLGASPMSSQASAHGGFQSGGASVGAKVPTNFNKPTNFNPIVLQQKPLVRGNNIVKIIGAVAALGVVGGLGYGGRVVQDKLSKPKQEPKIGSEGEPNPNQNSTQEPKVEIIEKEVIRKEEVIVEKFEDAGKFIEEHFGRCCIGHWDDRKAVAECIKKIDKILNAPDSNYLQRLTHGGYKVSRFANFGDFINLLYYAIVGYACGDSVKRVDQLHMGDLEICIKNLVMFETFAEEFQNSEKHEKIKQCIECLIELLSSKVGTSEEGEYRVMQLRDTLNFWPKLVGESDFCPCAEVHKRLFDYFCYYGKDPEDNDYGRLDYCIYYRYGGLDQNFFRFVLELYRDLVKCKGIDDESIESIRVVYNGQEHTFMDLIKDKIAFFGGLFGIQKLIVKCIGGKTYKFNYKSDERMNFSITVDNDQPATE